MKKRILVLGGLGMAGHMIVNYLSSLNKYIVYNTVSNKILDKNSIVVDVVDLELVKETIKEIKPDIIINCIGILNTASDVDIKNTVYINTFFPKLLENISSSNNIKIIHLSTDCVFTGVKGNYTEDDIKDEICIYGLSKSIGEIINKKDLTFRTSIIGPELKPNGSGLFNWFMNQYGSIYGYKNVYWSGVTTLELAKAIDKAIDDDLCGLYHLVYKEKISKFDLLTTINNEFNTNIEIKEDNDKICDKSLVNTRKDFNFEVSSYQDMIKEMKYYMLENKEIYSRYFS